ncbi:MAG: hypothetical protein AAF417_01795 [Pseudomonadota bacterium]
MTTKNSILAVTASLLLAPPVFACDYPGKIDIPNGATATRDEMLQGQRDVKQYVTDMEAYLDCIVAEEKTARADMDDLEAEDEQQREDMLNKKYNAAVDEMETVAANFNTEVQAFRARDE